MEIDQSYTWTNYHLINNGVGATNFIWADKLTNIPFVPDEVIVKCINFITGNAESYVVIIWSDIAPPNNLLYAFETNLNFNNNNLDIHYTLKRPVDSINFNILTHDGSGNLIKPPQISQIGNKASIGYTLQFVKYKTKQNK